jgi:hypothetical protein
MIGYIIGNGNAVVLQKNPWRDEYLIPEDVTLEKPPSFDEAKETVSFADGQWNVAEIVEEENWQPNNNIDPMENFRMERDALLKQCDFRVLPDYAGSDQEAWKSYRQKLRDMPAQIESGTLPKPTLDANNLPTEYPKWPTLPS